MSETSEPTPKESRILELTPNEDGTANFRIDTSTTSRDVLATLEYVQPSREIVEHYLDQILGAVIDSGKFNNILVTIGAPAGDDITPQVKFERKLKFGPEPKLEDVTTALTQVYGEDAPAMARRLVLQMIDDGKSGNIDVNVSVQNEFANADENDIAAEMQRMTDELYGFEGPTIE